MAGSVKRALRSTDNVQSYGLWTTEGQQRWLVSARIDDHPRNLAECRGRVVDVTFDAEEAVMIALNLLESVAFWQPEAIARVTRDLGPVKSVRASWEAALKQVTEGLALGAEIWHQQQKAKAGNHVVVDGVIHPQTSPEAWGA